MTERLRIVLEFKKSNLEDLELYSKLLTFGSPSNTVKDILKGLIPLEVLSKEVDEE